jgi:hypothetical protein
MNASTQAPKRTPRSSLFAWVILWFATYFVARGLLEMNSLAPWLRVVIALSPIPFAIAALVTLVRGAKELDELERRIQLEALAFAYPLTMLFIMVVGMMQRAVTLKFEDWSYLHVWGMLPIFYFLGLALARKRYA